MASKPNKKSRTGPQRSGVIVEERRDRLDVLVTELKSICGEVVKAHMAKKSVVESYKELEKQIGHIRAVQGYKQKSGSEMQDSKRDMKPFFQWLKANDFPNVDDYDVTFSPAEGHGLVCKKPLKKEDPILQVPLKFMMTNKTAIDSTRVALLVHNDPMLQDLYTLVLALHLMTEKYATNSFWAPYINSLPRVNHSPLYWSCEEVLQLEGSLFFSELVQYKAAIARQYCHVYFRLEKQLEIAVMKRSAFTWEAFLWAYSTVNARKNNIFVAGKGGNPVPCLALIPLYDLVNHEAAGEMSTYFDMEADQLGLYATRDFAKDEQVKMFYGPRPNSDFLLNQGFVPATNDYNFITLGFKLLESDPLFNDKCDVLRKFNIEIKDPRFKFTGTSFQPEVLAFLRVAWSMTKEELALAEEKAGEGPVSQENEVKAHQMLNLRLNQALAPFKKTPEEYQKELAEATSAQSSVASGLRVLIEERQILAALKVKVETKLKEFAELKKPEAAK